MIRFRQAPWLFLLLLAAVLLLVFDTSPFPQPAGEASVDRGPFFSPAPGMYDRTLRVELRPVHPRGKIIFTTDGTLPTLEVGTLYQQPIRLDAVASSVTVIRAIEVVEGVPGPVTSAAYAVGIKTALPILSIAADPTDFWDVDQGIFINTWERGDDWERPVSLSYFSGGDAATFTAPAGMRIHRSEPFDAEKQAFRLYFREDYGLPTLDYPLFPHHPEQPQETQSYKHLLLQVGDRSGRWTFFRDQLVAQVATQMGLRAAQGQFVWLFINGDSWGLYRLTERIDRFFLEQNYGLAQADVVQDGKTREGTDDDWDALVDWVEMVDLSEEEAYRSIESQIDLANFTDFAILQLYFDFPTSDLFAVHPRGGRWFWVYGGEAPGFAPDPATLFSALQPTDTKDDFALILRQLLSNTGYREFFSRRVADLLNTALEPAFLSQEVTQLVNLLQEEVQYEIARWPLPLMWEDNVTALQAFVLERPRYLRETVMELVGSNGSAPVEFGVAGDGGGRIFVNGQPIESLPWEGTYFIGTEVQAIAVPDPGYTFVSWEAFPDFSPAELGGSTVLAFSVDEPKSWRARFAPLPADDPALHPDDVVINEIWVNDNGTHYATVEGRPIEGDWLELLVRRPDTVDLRGWRITDNDTKLGTEEGSLIFASIPEFSALPRDTVILLLATETLSNDAYFGADDLDPRDGRLVLYVGNGNLNLEIDPGFGMGTGDDNVALLAPGATSAFTDDIGVDFVAEGTAVTPYAFGILEDGVTFDQPFKRIGGDDGALFTEKSGNDELDGWIVDPQLTQSGDAFRWESQNLVTPGALNPGQQRMAAWILWSILVAGGSLAIFLIFELYRRKR